MATTTPRRLLRAVWLAATRLVAGCATLPPGLDAPKPESTALAQPESTTLIWAPYYWEKTEHAARRAEAAAQEGTECADVGLAVSHEEA